jgi:hypothetical protein
MFFRKKPDPPADEKIDESAWDEKTVENFAKSRCFDVRITHITKRAGFGRALAEDRTLETYEYEISGVITFPKLVLVTVSLRREMHSEFGVWFYNLFLGTPQLYPRGAKEPDTPNLELHIRDPEGAIAETLYEAHKAALLSGRRYSLARFWKQEGEGVMTQKDKEQGWSFGSSYSLLGMYSWAVVEARNLPPWAAPHGSERYSTEDTPEHPGYIL